MHARRLTLTLILALGSSSLAVAQESRWEKRVRAFGAENRDLDPGQRHVVLFGSSSMEGWANSRRVERYLPTVGPRALNRGISGDGIGFTVGPGKKGLRNRVQASVFDCQPSHVFILNGRNSVGSGVDKTARAYRALVQQIRQRMPDVVVGIVTCAPVNFGYARLKAKVAQLNERLRRIARDEGCQLIDLFPHLVGPDGLLRPSLTRDGLHFSNAGYEILGREIERVVKESARKDLAGEEGSLGRGTGADPAGRCPTGQRPSESRAGEGEPGGGASRNHTGVLDFLRRLRR